MWKLLDPRSTAAMTSGTRERAMPKGWTLSGRERGRVSRRTGWFAARTCDQRSHGEGRTATAGCGRAGVADHELGAFDVLAIIDFGARQVLNAHRIDPQRDAPVVDARIALFLVLIESETVLNARAAAALHEDAQLEVRVGFLADQLTHLCGGGVGKNQAWSGVHGFHTACIWRRMASGSRLPLGVWPV